MRRWRQFVDRAGLHQAVVLLILLVLAGAAWGFVALADEVGEGGTLGFDTAILRVMRSGADPSRPAGPVWVEGMARDVTALGGVTVLTLVTAAAVGYLLLVRKRAAMVLVIVASVGALGISSGLKHLIGRERPSVVTHLQQVYTYSFPSGHSMISSAVYITLGSLMARLVEERRAKAYLLGCSLVVVFLIGVSRVYLGVHYPTDVLAGWTAGLAWGLVCWFVARLLQKRGAVERDDEGVSGGVKVCGEPSP